MASMHTHTTDEPIEAAEGGEFQKTACILCSINCGLQVLPQAGHLTKIRGDRQHPLSQGYTCEKAHRLDYYQNGRDRLSAPLRRRTDGTFETIDWDTAIREVAARLARVRDTFGGDTIFYYGGGAQGNHLPGAYARATRAALGSIYASNALAQEKTGEFWVDGRLFGAPKCHTSPDFEHAEVAIFVGKNPWHSHGSPRTRVVLKEIAADPKRTLIVIDPRRTETAELADIHIQLRPGRDAFVLAALCAILLREDLVDHAFLQAHCRDFETVREALIGIDIAAYAAHAGVAEDQLRQVARRIATASSVAMQEDLGLQQSPHSTLSSYLEKLVYLLVGSFARRGGMNLHSQFASLIGRDRDAKTPVGGHRIMQGMVPCNVIPDEILSEHPKRLRAMLVESANPAHSLADSPRMREALAALDTLVVIDVSLSETARLAHYVLPASSQFEKWETTFFNLEFPRNAIQLRAPLFPPRPGTLPEPEIHRRLLRALGAIDDAVLAPLQQAAAQVAVSGRLPFAAAFFAWQAQNPKLAGLAPVALYETLGPTLPHGAQAAAVLWAAAHLCAMSYPESVRRAGFAGEGPLLGEALFEAILHNRSGVVFTVDEPDETWRRIEHCDGRIALAIPELLAELKTLPDELAQAASPIDSEYPFVLSAGERRTSTANTSLRDPAWRKKDSHGALRISPGDAARLGIRDGGLVRITTRRGSATARAEISDTLLQGHASLPNGLGLLYPDENGQPTVSGVAPNELTSASDRDWLAGTPWHKHVRAQLVALP